MTLFALDAAPSGVASGQTPRVCWHHPSLRNLSVLLLSLALIQVKTASAQLDPVKNFCRRFGHQTAVIDRRLYVDGGMINYNPLSQYPLNYSNTGLLYHDLDRPGGGDMPQLYANLTKNNTVPSVSGGILWADNINKRFYLFGGDYYQQPPPPQFVLWSYDVINREWVTFGSPTQASIQSVSYGAGATIVERGEGYYLGGFKSKDSVAGWTGSSVAVSGLVKYSMDTNSWTNNTGPDSIGRAEGAMAFIPISDGGMLVYFGGVQDLKGNGTVIGQPMDQIFLYDVLSSKWYTQNATGHVPQMRRRFCAGAVWAQDRSSYNIYLYGGAGLPPDTAGFDDVYILTIPSFQWVKMDPTTEGNTTGARPHHTLTCNIIDNSQMLVLGGTFPLTDECDVPEQFGLHNLDLGQQNPKKNSWMIYAANKTTYTVPDPIIKVIGGRSTGGATKTAPDKGFNHPDLNRLMTRTANLPSRTPTRTIPTDEGKKGETNLPTGAIAGITIGAVIVFLAILIGGCWFVKRHKRNKRLKMSNNIGPTGPGPYWTQTPGNYPPQSPPRDGSSYTPNSPYPTNSPFLQRQQQQHPQYPVELPVEQQLGPDGFTYELVNTPPYASSHLVAGMGSSGSNNPSAVNLHSSGSPTVAGTGTSNSEPKTMVDEEGRLWVQVSPGGGGSPRVNNRAGSSPVVGVGAGLGLYPSGGGGGGGVSPNSPSLPMEPQELGTERERRGGEVMLGEGAGWDAAHGRPRHTTFYHP
ncbi:autophagy-related protein 3 [Podospora fimiseda]|uniref:Autophagy-related protein 3 n=1 Tax=Podospora fimiseda TaxID=252190 RepID=A0AAN7BXN3_9PEZI|nr:autophagy-related protein 3 [Podospora fimiseda]